METGGVVGSVSIRILAFWFAESGHWKDDYLGDPQTPSLLRTDQDFLI